MVLYASRAGMISQEMTRKLLGLDEVNMVTEPTYDEFRDQMLTMCLEEGTDIRLHNNCVTELLMFMDGGHPAFGNVVGEIYQMCETEGITPPVAAITIMRRAPPMYRKPTVA